MNNNIDTCPGSSVPSEAIDNQQTALSTEIYLPKRYLQKTIWYAPVAQWIEQRTSKPKVVGPIPTRGTKINIPTYRLVYLFCFSDGFDQGIFAE